MEEFEPSSRLGIGNCRVLAKNQRLDSDMEEFEPSSTLGIGNGGVRAKFGRLQSEMDEFKPNFDACNREWRSSSQVRTLGIGKG